MRKLLALVSILGLTSIGCGHGAVACQIIDAARAACSVIKYMGPDGKEYVVPVDKATLEELALAEAQKHPEKVKKAE